MIALLNANALHIPLAPESVQCVVTSPPYYGLRDYGTATWEGGSVDCDHKNLSYPRERETPGGRGGSMPMSETPYKDVCSKCGAIRVDRQIGLERTPQEYIDRLVSVFREVWRVLNPGGVVWLNLGDSYANNRGTGSSPLMGDKQKTNVGSHLGRTVVPDGLKQKDIIGIPWRVAFALQSDGWYLRSDIIWHKPNPMPESVTDRPTKAHEYIFLLSKNERYYYDAEAIQETAATGWNGSSFTDERDQLTKPGLGMKPRNGGGGYSQRTHAARRETISGGETSQRVDTGYRNKRTVWTVATSPYSGAHFATFPPKLVEPMILAGSRPGDIVLDPFAGTATVGRVAIKHQRRFIGLELNPAYIALAEDRTSNVQVAML